jgi:guanylate kinase
MLSSVVCAEIEITKSKKIKTKTLVKSFEIFIRPQSSQTLINRIRESLKAKLVPLFEKELKILQR